MTELTALEAQFRAALVVLAGEEVGAAIAAGRYPTVSREQRKLLRDALVRYVERLELTGEPEDVAACVRTFAQTAVRVVMGTPIHLN
jgi:hypothetical protein